MVVEPLQTFAGIDFGQRPEAIWLALGTVLMALGTLYFMVRGFREADSPRSRKFYVITTAIPAIAFASYLSMFQGFGLTELGVQGRGTLDIYWARYADWVLTTPLLLLDLGLLVGADEEIIGGAIIADVFMIVTGLVATLSFQPIFRYAWWFVSDLALLVILYFLYVSMTRRASEMDEETQSTFRVLRNLTLGLWIVYPIWWVVGTEGAGLVPLQVETLGFMVLDVLAKVGFGLILLRSRAVLGEAAAPEPSAAAGEAAPGTDD